MGLFAKIKGKIARRPRMILNFVMFLSRNFFN